MQLIALRLKLMLTTGIGLSSGVLLAAGSENFARAVRKEGNSGFLHDVVSLGWTLIATALFSGPGVIFHFLTGEEATYAGLNFDDFLFVLNGIVHCLLDFGGNNRFYIDVISFFNLDGRRLSSVVDN